MSVEPVQLMDPTAERRGYKGKCLGILIVNPSHVQAIVLDGPDAVLVLHGGAEIRIGSVTHSQDDLGNYWRQLFEHTSTCEPDPYRSG